VGDARVARRLAGKAFLVFGSFGLLAAIARGSGPTFAAVEAFVACLDLALGVLLLGDAEWPRVAAIVRACVGIASALASPFVFRNARAQLALLAVMVFFFFCGMLILLPGSAGRARRWAGALVAFAPYFLLKFVVALGSGFFDGRDFVRAFLQMG
jgi:hypothetical protein